MQPPEIRDSVRTILGWYDANARDLPWRGPSVTPWAVLVSEFMLQQTPVARVAPAFEAWMRQWPTPADLASASTGDAVRAWGKLGYPRRALRLHATACAIVEHHGEQVPATVAELRALPGVGDYTANAVVAFAFGRRSVVLDTNVRRLLARLARGEASVGPSITAAERQLADEWTPTADREAATWSVAAMELAALVCTATTPACHRCPVVGSCAWYAAGQPAGSSPTRPSQSYAGTDRQCRGRLLDVVRDSQEPATAAAMAAAWADDNQRERCLDSLLDDGLVVLVADDLYALPG